MARALREGLSGEGYEVVVARTGEDGFFRASSEPFDLLILDRMLPGREGLEILRALRQKGLLAPVLVLTARDAVEDRVEGLDSGADDYMVKPFAFTELLARVRALVRRGRGDQILRLTVADLVLDVPSRSVTRGDAEIDLTPREYELLEYLVRHRGTIVSREMLARDVWKEPERGTPLDNVIDVHVTRLRKKVDQGFAGEAHPHRARRGVPRPRGRGGVRPAPGGPLPPGAREEDTGQRRFRSLATRIALWYGGLVAVCLLAYSVAVVRLLHPTRGGGARPARPRGRRAGRAGGGRRRLRAAGVARGQPPVVGRPRGGGRRALARGLEPRGPTSPLGRNPRSGGPGAGPRPQPRVGPTPHPRAAHGAGSDPGREGDAGRDALSPARRGLREPRRGRRCGSCGSRSCSCPCWC